MLTAHDIYLFKEGSHASLYREMGCHLDADGGATFSVWAPNASEVSVIGEWNGWAPDANQLAARWDESGIWETRVPAVTPGQAYKFRVTSRDGHVTDKADPFAFFAEAPPQRASRVWSLDYAWEDSAWMQARAGRNNLNAPMSVYEVHLGSWRRGDNDRMLNYREMAPQLAEYVAGLGFTHIELMPITEHPFYGSWGYQTTGYFAPTARYGTPQDFMYFVDVMHAHGLGVLLDWVPSHFPGDEHGLAMFDGTRLYEHSDPRQGFHPEWQSYIFNYGRHEVRAFLLSSAVFWLDVYHLDGLRVDAVASMLYLDYARQPGTWIPNEFGGKENLDAIRFLRDLNTAVYRHHGDVQTIAEESTAYPQVSHPVHAGGLGFGMKWNMGWMHDTLDYFAQDPVYRRYHHDRLTFSLWYAFTENFVLPLSHDEVVYGKRALCAKMPGDAWQQFANLRLLFGYMWTHPGKKLLFMGGEFGQRREWNHDTQLDWWICEHPEHAGIQRWIGDLNRAYRDEPALHDLDFSRDGFQWVDGRDIEASVLCFLRVSERGETVLVVANFTPVVRETYRVGVPSGGRWRELLNSDATIYGGSGVGNMGGVEAEGQAAHGRPYSLALTLPPLAMLIFRPEAAAA
jgi:1,4-alpha-glucan branching enzyme